MLNLEEAGGPVEAPGRPARRGRERSEASSSNVLLEGCCFGLAESASCVKLLPLHFTPSHNTSRGEEVEVKEELYLT